MNCPKCGVAVTADEKFCSGCGAGIAVSGDGNVILYDRIAPMPTTDVSGHLGTARKWLLAISIITLISGVVFYMINKSEIDKQHADAAAQIAHLSPAERDAALRI